MIIYNTHDNKMNHLPLWDNESLLKSFIERHAACKMAESMTFSEAWVLLSCLRHAYLPLPIRFWFPLFAALDAAYISPQLQVHWQEFKVSNTAVRVILNASVIPNQASLCSFLICARSRFNTRSHIGNIGNCGLYNHDVQNLRSCSRSSS
jgi:hypothetical protein